MQSAQIEIINSCVWKETELKNNNDNKNNNDYNNNNHNKWFKKRRNQRWIEKHMETPN